MFEILVTTITIVFVIISFLMVLLILLQSGKGGMGAALGGGASQSVFGGGGSADVLAKGTQYLAASFMICAIFLAYAGAHSGSSRLQDMSTEIEQRDGLFGADEEINFEAIGNMPLPETNTAVEKTEAPPSQAPADDAVEEPADPVEAVPAPLGDGDGDANPDDAAAAEAPADANTPAEPEVEATPEAKPADAANAEKTPPADAKADAPATDK